MKRRQESPPWCEWELELTDYTYKPLRERDCTEIELRRMMEHAAGYRPRRREGRWVIDTRFRGEKPGEWSWNPWQRSSG